MKKTILAAAVAASTFAGVAHADGTTLYGSLRFAYTYTDQDAVKMDKRTDAEESNLGNAGSRFGISGENSLGNGLTAFYKYENRISDQFNSGSSLTTDQLYAGISGDFGAISVGTQTLPTDGMSNQSDPFNSLTPGGGLSQDNRDKTPNSLVYASPSLSGFSFEAGIVVNGSETSGSGKKTDLDAYNVGVSYEANGLFAGLAYSNNETNGDEIETLVGGVGYSAGNYGIGLFAQQVIEDERTSNKKQEPYFLRLSGFYNLNDKNSVYAGVGFSDVDRNKDNNPGGRLDDDELFFSVGYRHDLSKNTRVWAEYGYSDKADTIEVGDTTKNDNEAHKVALGFRTDF